MARNQKDYFYDLAQKEGYRSRASYKLKQIQQHSNIIKRGDTIVDLGAAPGGWLQVAKELSGGRVLGVDLQKIAEIPGVSTYRGDITADSTIEKILEFAGKGGVDVVLCDAAPNLTGNWALDHARGIELNRAAFECAKKILKPKGTFVVKVFQGDMFKDFFDDVKGEFVHVKAYTPQASRSTSAEIYIIAKKFLTAPIRKGQIYAAEIKELGASGDGIAYIDDFVLFVKETEVGDIVNIKVKDVKPNFGFAEVVEKLEALPENPRYNNPVQQRMQTPLSADFEKEETEESRPRGNTARDNYRPPKSEENEE
ncbi:Ribosomal RNA large subunit methyltransferase E [Methanimicrococcus sp. At1]|uniref:Ribosomal RNA large subunit methyltransferase E n=1 Tax=Methanimicrococcus hacksteinii TaxID=3028293 RepID=A0ABU3VQC2_9EURY|nr:23S rRNA (uridine(2552)-2'-O)-methyltransferase [Methanimicrococcus sp. At1]MDV0445620.1 Ribosomal RNA large subunit methyltransferase E [Methanimicrococcus sp. At1]